MREVLDEIKEEARRVSFRYGPPTSTQESLGVLVEEVDELKDAIRANSREEIIQEAVQVAAAAYRLARECSSNNERFLARSGLLRIAPKEAA